MKNVENVLGYIIAVFTGLAFGFIITMGIKGVEIETIENQMVELENKVVESYDKGYLDGENHALLDLMEDYYAILIENAVLKERLKYQPSHEEYIEQILDDMELLIELQQHYYRANITSHSFGDWLQINYPALYQRLLNYY